MYCQAETFLPNTKSFFHSKLKNWPAYLQIYLLPNAKWNWLPHKHKSSELGCLVTHSQIPSVALARIFDKFKCWIMPTDANICYTHFAASTSANLSSTPCRKVNNVDGLWSAISKRLNNHVLDSSRMDHIIKKTQHFAIDLHLVTIGCFAYLTLETFPDVRVHKRSLFLVSFAVEPLSYAIQVDVFYWTDALTRTDYRIIRLLLTQTDPAAHFFWSFSQLIQVTVQLF